MNKSPKTTVICAVWHKDEQRKELVEQHFDNLRSQSVPVEVVYVFDNRDLPPKAVEKSSVVVGAPLTIYEAWNVALSMVRTPYVANLNLDDRFCLDAIELLENSIEALSGDFVGGDWRVLFDQASVNSVGKCDHTSALPFKPEWPPDPGVPVRLGSGTGERGTYGPATLWKMDCHASFPRYPYRMDDNYLIKSAGDAIWWDLLIRYGKKKALRVDSLIGHYLSNPAHQAEFRVKDELTVLGQRKLSML